jgi:hypothetical protein
MYNGVAMCKGCGKGSVAGRKLRNMGGIEASTGESYMGGKKGDGSKTCGVQNAQLAALCLACDHLLDTIQSATQDEG